MLLEEAFLQLSIQTLTTFANKTSYLEAKKQSPTYVSELPHLLKQAQCGQRTIEGHQQGLRKHQGKYPSLYYSSLKRELGTFFHLSQTEVSNSLLAS